MLKKFFLGFLVFLFLVNTVIAADIGYIVKTSYPVNTDQSAIINLLESNGHNVSFLDDNDIINPNLYDLIIVGEDIPNIEGLFDNRYHKTLFLSHFAAYNAGLSQKSGATTNNKIEITDNTNRITEDFAIGEKTIYSPSDTVSYLYGCEATNSQDLAHKLYENRDVILILREDSLLLKDNLCTKKNIPIYERNMFFGLSGASSWNSDSKDLFINSINWLIEGEDNDGDGYYYNEDCDDNDSTRWQLLEGYTDNDNDGYGSVELLDVCSGDELPIGYSEINTDCDDTDENKYQLLEGYLDSDNDGYGAGTLLDVCSGDELPIGYSETKGDCDDTVNSCNIDCVSLNYLDADGDSYGDLNKPHRACDASSDYVSDSNDCDDTDENINPDADELQYDMIDSNCDNSAELLSEIPNITWDEDNTASIDLNEYIWNPNNNDLEFYVLATSNDKHIFIHSTKESSIVNFSSQENWWGDDWVSFLIADNETYLETNEITLKVLPINDAPEIIDEEYLDVTLDEDFGIWNFNLGPFEIDNEDYGEDLEWVIESVDGPFNAEITSIVNDTLTLTSIKDEWCLEECGIMLKLVDSGGLHDREYFNVVINPKNEPPEFGLIDCQTEINEDEEYTCELSATDFENDSLEFSVSDENNLNCNIDGNELEYKSDKDYNGEASCMLRVDDGNDYDEYLLEVNILAVNDAPIITDYSPKGAIKLMENANKLFSITASDIDEDSLEIKWFLNDLEAGAGNTYTFNKPKGNYNLTASVTDNIAEPVTKTFNVFVGDVSDFTCQEVGGYVIAENQTCLGELLGVKDINNCCSVQGSPKFSEADRCEAFNNSISIEIKEPDENDKFIIGEKINFNLEVGNNLNDDFNFDIRVYLYDITSDDKIEDDKDSIKIKKTDSKETSFEFEIPEDLDETHQYAVFVRAIEKKDGLYCNEQYLPINIERQEHDVIIENLEINPINLTCGDYLNFDVKLKNTGTSDEDVFLLIENPKLGIKEQTPEFELEKYNDKDTITRIFSIKVPEGIESGEYDVKLTSFFDNGNEKNTLSREISVDCKQIEQKTQEVQKISLAKSNEEAQAGATSTNKTPGIILLIIMLASLIAIFIILFIEFKRRLL